MDSDCEFWVWIVATVAVLVMTFAGIMVVQDMKVVSHQTEVDKLAISSGLCQVQNVSGMGWPYYHYEKCK